MKDALEKSAGIVQIDENRLDRECIRLAGDYLQFAHLAADARLAVDESKAEMDVTQAEIAKDVRADPTTYGIEKLTEAALQAAVLVSKDFKQAQQAHFEAKHEYEMIQAVVWALEHKKRSLTLLVELHGMGYFSSAKVSPAGKQAVEEMTKNAVRRNRD